MRQTIITAVLLTILVTGTASYAQEEEKQEKLSVFIYTLFDKKTGLGGNWVTGISDTFESYLIKQLRKSYRIISDSSVQESLEREGLKQSLGCDSEKCIKDIITASSADYFIYGTITPWTYGKYTFTVTLMYREPESTLAESKNQISQKITYQQINKDDELQKFIEENADLLIVDLVKKEKEGPDNVIKQKAKVITQATGAKGNFLTAEKINYWYKLNKANANKKSFILSHDSGRDFDIYIYDGENENPVLKAESGSLSEKLDMKNLLSDNCYVKIANYSGFGPYTLTIKDYVDPIETAKFLIGNKATGNFPSTNKEEHWYKMKTKDIMDKSLVLSHNQGQDFDVAVYDKQGSNKIVYGELASNPEIITTRGKYLPDDLTLIKVWNYQGSGPYTLTIEKEAPKTIPPQGAQVKTEYGMFLSGYIPTTSKTEQWFKLNGQQGQSPTFQIFHGNNADFDFEVYSNNDKVCSATGSSSGDQVKCNNIKGQCHVKVWNHNGSGSFTINIKKF